MQIMQFLGVLDDGTDKVRLWINVRFSAEFTIYFPTNLQVYYTVVPLLVATLNRGHPL